MILIKLQVWLHPSSSQGIKVKFEFIHMLTPQSESNSMGWGAGNKLGWLIVEIQ